MNKVNTKLESVNNKDIISYVIKKYNITRLTNYIYILEMLKLHNLFNDVHNEIMYLEDKLITRKKELNQLRINLIYIRQKHDNHFIKDDEIEKKINEKLPDGLYYNCENNELRINCNISKDLIELSYKMLQLINDPNMDVEFDDFNILQAVIDIKMIPQIKETNDVLDEELNSATVAYDEGSNHFSDYSRKNKIKKESAISQMISNIKSKYNLSKYDYIIKQTLSKNFKTSPCFREFCSLIKNFEEPLKGLENKSFIIEIKKNGLGYTKVLFNHIYQFDNVFIIIATIHKNLNILGNHFNKKFIVTVNYNISKKSLRVLE